MSSELLKYRYDKSDPIINEKNYMVYKGLNSQNKMNVLICILLNKNFDEQLQNGRKHQQFTFIVKQIEKLKDIKHKNITKIYQIIKKTQDQFIFALQQCQYGSVIDYLKKEKFFDQRFSIYIAHQICLGLTEIHKLGVVHGYINLENFQIDSQGTFKLSLKCLILKAFYLSPQFKLDRNRDKLGDVFSLGIALYKMMYGVFPYTGKTNQQMLKNIKKQQKRTTTILNPELPFQIFISKQIQNLIFKMTSYEKQNRAFLEDIIRILDSKLQDEEKLKRFPKEVEDEYFIFNYKQTIQHDKYYKQLIFTCIRKKNKQLRKLKVIPLSKDSNESEITNKYIEKLPFFHESNMSGQKFYVRNSFLSVCQHFLTSNSLIIIHQYFNQTYLQQYLNNKTKIMPFKDNQIDEIIYYSNEAIRLYNQEVGPYGWLSVKNIYIKQGILKIGLPCLQFENIKKVMSQMKNYPDYLAPEKKSDKKINQTVDIWSLGIMKYFMTYESYPKFDNKDQIQFPSKPNINLSSKNFLNDTLQLNPKQRILFHQLEYEKPSVSRICNYYQISMQQASKLNKLGEKKINIQTQINQMIPVVIQPPIIIQDVNVAEMSKLENYLLNRIVRSFFFRKKFYLFIQNQTNKYVRGFFKIIICFVLFIVLFYAPYFINVNSLVNDRTNFSAYTVKTYFLHTDTSIYSNYTLLTLNSSFFESTNFTFFEIRDEMNCARDYYFNPNLGGSKQHLLSYINSKNFLTFQVFGIFLIFFNILSKILQIIFMDIPRIMVQISQEPKAVNQFLRYIFLQFAVCSLVSFHYLIYGSFYHMSTSPCLTNPLLPSLKYLFVGQTNYYLIYVIGVIIAYVVVTILCIKDKNYIINKYIYLVLFILYLISIGLRGLGGFIYKLNSYNTWISICGVFPQLLQFIIIAISQLVDIVFWCFRKYKKINQQHRLKEFEMQGSEASVVTQFD